MDRPNAPDPAAARERSAPRLRTGAVVLLAVLARGAGLAARHCSSQRVIRLDAAGPLVSWDNARLQLNEEAVDERN